MSIRLKNGGYYIMHAEKYKVIAICGSLRKKSYNRILVQHCIDFGPEQLDTEFFDIGTLPLYNQDMEDQGFPDSVLTLRKKIREADALIVACPEYNMSVSGVLKNAIDWVSRKDNHGFPFSKKPVMIIGATPGQLGTARAQKELRSILSGLNTYPMNKPELFMTDAENKINDQILDTKVTSVLDKMLVNFISWIKTIKES